MKATPGPWNACNKGNCVCKQIWGKDHPVATVIAGKWGDDYPSLRITGESLKRRVEAYMEQITYGEISEELAIANAHLIAAAPKLLEACKRLLEAFDATGPCDCGGSSLCAICEAQAAIAKAEGESHR